MLDPTAETAPDRRPAIVVCVYEADDPALPLLDEARGAAWALPGTRVRLIGPGDPPELAGRISEDLALSACQAVLLIGRAKRGDSFRIQMRAENRTLAGGGKWSSTGPAMARATAPVSGMVRALTSAGLEAEATSESEDDVGSYLLYRILTALPDDADVPAVALVRVPVAMDPDRVRQGIVVAAGAMARHLSPLPRERMI